MAKHVLLTRQYVLAAIWVRQETKVEHSYIVITILHWKITLKNYLKRLHGTITQLPKWNGKCLTSFSFIFCPWRQRISRPTLEKNGWNVLKCISLLMMWKMQHTRERCWWRAQWHLWNTSRSRRRERLCEKQWLLQFECLFSAKSKQNLRKLHVQKCFSEFWWIARFLLHTAEASCSNMWVYQRRWRNQVTHNRVLFIFMIMTKSSTRRHGSWSLTRLWPWSRNVWQAS